MASRHHVLDGKSARGPQGWPAMHQIGEVAERVGLSLRTVRHYDEAGPVVPSGRTVGGFRLYTDDDVERLVLIERLKPLGFALDEMRELLAVRDRLVRTDPDYSQLLDRLQGYATATTERCENLRTQLVHADAFTDTLRREVTRYSPVRPDEP